MTDPERREQIAQEDNIRQVIWRIAGLHTLTEIQATLLARLILRREETWQREIVKPLEHGLDLRAEVIANHVAENKRLLKVAEAARAVFEWHDSVGEPSNLSTGLSYKLKHLQESLDALAKEKETP